MRWCDGEGTTQRVVDWVLLRWREFQTTFLAEIVIIHFHLASSSAEVEAPVLLLRMFLLCVSQGIVCAKMRPVDSRINTRPQVIHTWAMGCDESIIIGPLHFSPERRCARGLRCFGGHRWQINLITMRRRLVQGQRGSATVLLLLMSDGDKWVLWFCLKINYSWFLILTTDKMMSFRLIYQSIELERLRAF